MALADILHAIREEAAQERARLEEAFRAEHEARRQAAEARARARAQEIEAEEHARAESEATELLASAALDARAATRAAQERVVASGVERVAARVARAHERDDWEEVLGALVDEALTALPDATVFEADPRDADAVTARLRAAGCEARVDPQATPWGGVRAATDDGRAVDNRLASRLRAAEPALRRALWGELAERLKIHA